MILRQQLELGIGTANNSCPSPHRRQRVERARWWFEQMRRAVDEARDWPSSGDAGSGRTGGSSGNARN